ncbi:PepSY domain-containing protein [Bradyrhizobium sp. HKCCYLR20261]|uniref:PepSY domain-containing protein n=1 Tax=Bradyrhizobium sp. HKCCYLR20261 TaxID=3420760 RepID=UPI003EBC3195
MNKQLLLKLHRWISLTFALPLLVIIATGLILSFEPIAQVAAVKPGSVDPARVVALIKQYDPDGKARGISINPTTQHLTLQGRPGTELDMATGAVADKPAASSVFQWARMTHEHLIGIEGLTTISTIGMIVIMIIGILMGLPRLRNTLSGWHKGAAWFTLPLIMLSPLTGVLLDPSNSFFSAPATAGKRVSLTEAVSIVARDHDLATVNMIGTRGGRMLARIIEGDELRAYAVTADGVSALPRNWVRLLHEGNWSLIGSTANVLISVVLLALLITGVLIWTQRRLRRPKRTGDAQVKPAVATSAPT